MVRRHVGNWKISVVGKEKGKRGEYGDWKIETILRKRDIGRTGGGPKVVLITP